MIDWSISAELFSLILLLVLMLSFREKRWTFSTSSRIYRICLRLSAIAILLNLICVCTLHYSGMLPRWVNLVLNSAYFLVAVLLSTTMAYYLLYLVLEHVYDRHCMRQALAVLLLLFGLYVLILAVNLFTGIIFSLDPQGIYRRGPGINLGYGIMGIQLLIVLVCAWNNRSSISAPLLHVIRILPPAVLLLTIYQIAFPQILLNGSLFVVADLLLFLNFQSRRIEVDSLTWVNNRSSFFQEVTLRLSGRQQFQVLVVALRRFSFINQHYGHHNGDGLLVQIAAWLNGLQPQGKTFRVGNVGFAVLLPYTSADSAQHLRMRVYERFQQPWIVGGSQVVLENHVAELIHIDQDWNATDVLEFLKYSLKIAADREDHLVCFDESLYQDLEQRRRVLQLLHQAIQKKSFQVWYQPLYCRSAGGFASAEALLRLRDEEGNLVPTELFISVAEESGLLDELSWLLLDEVCSLLGSSQVPQLHSIAINLSMHQFMSDTLLERVRSSLMRYQVPPGRLKIEITERVLAQDLKRVCRLMTQFSEMNVEFYLDDFGTGYSNLATVLDLPFGCVKLDHGLICGLPNQEQSRLLVHTVLQLFHNIGCQVVAEGVEQPEQAAILAEWGIDWMQGYYFSPPLPQQELVAFLQNSSEFEMLAGTM